MLLWVMVLPIAAVGIVVLAIGRLVWAMLKPGYLAMPASDQRDLSWVKGLWLVTTLLTFCGITHCPPSGDAFLMLGMMPILACGLVIAIGIKVGVFLAGRPPFDWGNASGRGRG
jgi:hypothetical protein